MRALPSGGVVAEVPPLLIGEVVRKLGWKKEEMLMKRFLVSLSLGLLMAAPLVAGAAASSSAPANLPAAVDQLLAQDMIQLAESQLKVAGFDPGRVDGIFDAQTSEAVRKYQAARGLPVSGLLDEPTRRELWAGYENANED
jgi:peptidoglycan hydrolase-like protein with peptidoglycan-binding domain